MSSSSPSSSAAATRREEGKDKENKELDGHEAIAQLQALIEEGEWEDEESKAMATDIIQEVEQILKDADEFAAGIETPEEEEIVTPEPVAGDGFSWVNYGSEVIPQFAHPRLYYRCAHTGCDARREVQQVDGEDPPMYRVTFVNGHTCKPIVSPAGSHSIPPIDSTEGSSFNKNVDEIQQDHQHSNLRPPEKLL